jgi:hypothetical protein
MCSTAKEISAITREPPEVCRTGNCAQPSIYQLATAFYPTTTAGGGAATAAAGAAGPGADGPGAAGPGADGPGAPGAADAVGKNK